MLQLVLGRAGTGKTHLIREMLQNKVASGEKKLMLLVPEQNSFENEREMLKLVGADQMAKLSVMSFSRLTDLVFRETGGIAGRRLDDGGRNILMSLALEQVKDHLTLYRRHSLSSELVPMMIAALKEFKMCSISPEALFETAGEVPDETLKSKMSETALILSAYEALLARSYLDPLDDLTRLRQTLEQHAFFRDYTILIDGFYGFTPQEMQIMELLLRQAKECVVGLCIDPYAEIKNKLDLFSPVNKTLKGLMAIAKKNMVTIKPPIELMGTRRFENSELRMLEEASFQINRDALEDPVENVVLYNAAQLYDEADFVANTIKKLVLEEGIRYRDFAVIARTTKAYLGIIDTTFEKHDIPYFMDKREPIDSKPLMNLTLTAFEIIHSSYESDAIFRYLKTGLTDLTVEEISLLENYTLLWSISGIRWKEPFTAHPKGFCEQTTKEDEQTLKQINLLRERVVRPLERFSDNIRQGTGQTFSKAVYLLLEEIGALKSLKSMARKLNEEGERTLCEEQLRLWDLLISILDQTALVLKNQFLSSKRYAELLQLVITANDIAFIPQGLDEVTIGDADRIRLENPKIVFLIGAEEGEFPRSPVVSGVFSDAERKDLISMGLPMYDSLEDLVVEERFLAYRSMTSASKRLYVTWSSSDSKGTGKTPSAIVREIKRILPKIKILDEYCLDWKDRLWSQKPVFELFAKHYREHSRFSKTLLQYFSESEQYGSKIRALKRVAEGVSLHFNDPKKAKEFFGDTIRLSASQIEKYYLCRFQYFCQYGLCVKERKPVSFDSLEYGSLMHYILEHLLAANSKQTFCTLDSEQIKKEVSGLMEDYVQTKLGGWKEKSSRFRYLFIRLSKTAEMLVLHLVKEFSQSEFQPVDYELGIGEEDQIEPLCLKLPDGAEVSVLGKVDRVDVMRKDGKAYLRVVDYKTGSKVFRLSDVLYGLNMQMLLYLCAICKNGKERYGEMTPAGILYMPAVYPVVGAEQNATDEKILLERQKKLRMNGLILDDPMVIRGMESGARGIFIPVALKDGKPAKRDSVANLSELGALTKHMESLVISMAETLRSGDVSRKPAEGEYDACQWCPYLSVCGFEKGEETRQIKKWDRDAVLEELKKEGEDNIAF